MSLWDFLGTDGENTIQRWAGKERLTSRDRGKLEAKLSFLTGLDFPTAWQTKLLDGPIHKYRHIYKLVVHGAVMLRPMLCKGPINNDTEYTILQGAKEVGGRLQPENAPERAERNREDVVRDPSRRREHEPF